MFFRYSEWDESRHGQNLPTFDKLFDLFQQLLYHTGGDADEALRWLTQLDNKYGLGDNEMGIGDFIEELQNRGIIERDEQTGVAQITAKGERGLRQRSLEDIFSHLRKSGRGGHKTPFAGAGDERLPETRPFTFGDDIHSLDVTGTLSNAFRRSGLGDFSLSEDDFQVYETDHHTSVATVLMIDLSHSMVLYGEDRITPARKTAMALAELIMTRYPKDTLDIVAFGNEAWEVKVKDLPYLQVGPFHTNTRAGLERARDDPPPPEEPQQADLHDHRRQAERALRGRPALQELVRARPEDREQGARRGRHLPPRADHDHDVHDRPRPLPPELRPRADRDEPGPRLLRRARRPRRVHLRGLRPQPPQIHAVKQ